MSKNLDFGVIPFDYINLDYWHCDFCGIFLLLGLKIGKISNFLNFFGQIL